ncbi:MAG: phosphatase PAP2 family protein [Eubacterium sp.]|nr:phosphatase PAP2 family protein [Eubacterium sp.]
MLNILSSLDDNILLFFQEVIRNPVMTPILKVITTLGNGGAIWIALTVLLLLLPKTRKVGFMTSLSLIGTLLINNMFLKNLVNRTRPYEVIEGLTYLVRTPTDSSFPSGHSACAFAVACIMFRRLPKRYGIPALVLAIVIALSRLYVGVHYPSDVLFGTLSGIVISYAAEAVAEWILKRKVGAEDAGD